MRNIWLGSAIAVAAILFPQQGWAYDGPWCAVLNFGSMGPSENCSLPSFEACRALAMQYGSSSFCRQNAGWPGYRRPGEKSPEHHKKRRHHG